MPGTNRPKSLAQFDPLYPSIIELGKGTKVSALTKDSSVYLLDFPSINVLTRSIIEAFLTLEYLFFNDLDEEERKFRFNIWRISGYKSRQSFFERSQNLNAEVNQKLQEEFDEIERLLEVIKKSPYYGTMNKHSLWKLDKYGLPRLESWQKLLEQSILKTSVFEIPYKLYSNYAHSEFISLIQMNGSDTLNKGSKINDDHILNALRVVKMINCIAIISLKNKFDFAEKVFEKYDEETKTTILFWNEFGIE